MGFHNLCHSGLCVRYFCIQNTNHLKRWICVYLKLYHSASVVRSCCHINVMATIVFCFYNCLDLPWEKFFFRFNIQWGQKYYEVTSKLALSVDIELSIEKAEVFQLSHVSFSLTNFLPHSFILPGSFHLSHFDEKQKKISCTVFAWKWQRTLVTSSPKLTKNEKWKMKWTRHMSTVARHNFTLWKESIFWKIPVVFEPDKAKCSCWKFFLKLVCVSKFKFDIKKIFVFILRNRFMWSKNFNFVSKTMRKMSVKISYKKWLQL